ncbi:MAG TPA: glycine cleavage system protein GcvH [Clostridiaceae bacterium]|nr:glycine cleavage system protein GcvH [Clostridiaceae bacterium]
MSELRDDVKYAKSHEWVKVEGDIAVIGLTDYAQDQMGDLVFAEVVPAGTTVAVEDSIGSVESVKMASDVYAPVAGEVVEANDTLEDAPEQINETPYDTWLVKIRLSDPAELDQLLDKEGYAALIAEES